MGRSGPSAAASARRVKRGVPWERAWAVAALLTLLMLAAAGDVRADDAVVTVIADFENNSVAVGLGALENISPADCALRTAAVPARGQQSLLVEIGATRENASVVCDLHVRMSTSFARAQRAAMHVYLQDAPAEAAIRLRDAQGRLFETALQSIRSTRRWERVAFALSDESLRPIGFEATPATAAPRWPLEVVGLRLAVRSVGKQTVFIDDLEIEHSAALEDVAPADFAFDSPTHLYEPGALVRPTVWLENRSREKALRVSVEIAWQRPDGTVIKTDTANVNLPAGAGNFRARNPVELSQRIETPGLYRLIARVRGEGWTTSRQFESTFAVLPSNASLARAQSTFFGVRTNLLREPKFDRLLEISVADTIGVQLLVIETPWQLIEPTEGVYRFAELDEIVEEVARRGMEPAIALSEPPAALPAGAFDERQSRLLESLVRHFGRRVTTYQLAGRAEGAEEGAASAAALVKALRAIQPAVEIVHAPVSLESGRALPAAGDGLRRSIFSSTARGDPRSAFQSFEKKHAVGWQRGDWWIHEAPLRSGGSVDDLSAVVRNYVTAARSGMGALIWADLRDDAAGPGKDGGVAGLLRRDFSPKATLLGFASIAGVVSSLRCLGEAPGAPPETDSLVFLAPNRQVIVLAPRPNCVLPAVVQPTSDVPGELAVLDFARRGVQLLPSAFGALAPLHDKPMFFETTFERIQDQGRVGFSPSWLRAPSVFPCGADRTVTIEVDPPIDLSGASLALRTPPGAPYSVPFSSRRIEARAGKPAAIEIKLTPLAGRAFERSTLTLRFTLEGEVFELPVEVRPVIRVCGVAAEGNLTAPEHRLGELLTVEGRARATPGLGLYAAHGSDALLLGVELPGTPATGDLLSVRAAAEGEIGVSLDVLLSGGKPVLSPDRTIPGAVARLSPASGGRPHLVLAIPRASLAPAFAEPRKPLLLDVRYRSVTNDAVWSWSEWPESAGLMSTGRLLLLDTARR